MLGERATSDAVVSMAGADNDESTKKVAAAMTAAANDVLHNGGIVHATDDHKPEQVRV